MYKHYVYRIKGTEWYITENHHTVCEMSGSHGGADSDYCFVLFSGLRLPPPRNHNQIVKHTLITSLES
jgi:hypothetical protein